MNRRTDREYTEARATRQRRAILAGRADRAALAELRAIRQHDAAAAVAIHEALAVVTL